MVSGDEDQGLMGSLAVLIKLGLFQLNGGTEENPSYEFGSPLFDDVTISLQNGKSLRLTREGEGVYIDGIHFNEKPVTNLYISHNELSIGGELAFKMKKTP